MSRRLRPAASVCLMLGLLAGPAARGLVVAHVAGEHAATGGHHAHHAGHGHHGHSHEAPASGHAEPGHAADHSHDLAPAPVVASARTAGPACDLEAPPARASAGADLGAGARAPARVPPAGLRPGPPQPKRQVVLLI